MYTPFAPHRHVLVFVRRHVRAAHRTRAPYHRAVNREIAQGNSPPTDSVARFRVGQRTVSPDVSAERSVDSAGAFHTPRCVSVLAMTPRRSRKARMFRLPVQVRGRTHYSREVQRGISRAASVQRVVCDERGQLTFAQSFPAPSMPPADRPAAPLAALRSTATRCCRSHQQSGPSESSGMHNKLKRSASPGRIAPFSRPHPL